MSVMLSQRSTLTRSLLAFKGSHINTYHDESELSAVALVLLPLALDVLAGLVDALLYAGHKVVLDLNVNFGSSQKLFRVTYAFVALAFSKAFVVVERDAPEKLNHLGEVVADGGDVGARITMLNVKATITQGACTSVPRSRP